MPPETVACRSILQISSTLIGVRIATEPSQVVSAENRSCTRRDFTSRSASRSDERSRRDLVSEPAIRAADLGCVGVGDSFLPAVAEGSEQAVFYFGCDVGVGLLDGILQDVS